MRIAINELRNPRTRVRSLAIATTAALAVLGTVEFQGTQANLAAGLDASARAIDSSADVWITPGGESNAFATTSFIDTRQTAQLAHIPGVQTLSHYRGSFVNWGTRRLWVLAPPAAAAGPLLEAQLVTGQPPSVAREVAAGGWAVLSRALAHEQHLRVGQSFTLPSPSPTTLRVAGLSSNLGWPPGAIIMNSADYATAWRSPNPSALQLSVQATASPEAVRLLVHEGAWARNRPRGRNGSPARAAPLRASEPRTGEAHPDTPTCVDRGCARSHCNDGRFDLAATRARSRP